jgi:hypothetical protein
LLRRFLRDPQRNVEGLYDLDFRGPIERSLAADIEHVCVGLSVWGWVCEALGDGGWLKKVSGVSVGTSHNSTAMLWKRTWYGQICLAVFDYIFVVLKQGGKVLSDVGGWGENGILVDDP